MQRVAGQRATLLAPHDGAGDGITSMLEMSAAYAQLGDITIFNPKRQHGLYLSLQAGF